MLEHSKALIVSMTIALCVVGILAGCQPKAPSGSTQEGASSEQQNVSEGSSGSSMPGDFKVADAGVWSDTQYAQSMNAGNRGCNACHADLFSVLPTGEVYKKAGFGRVYTYNDCVTCHVDPPTARLRAMPECSYTIHGYHYGNQEFLAKGNCFSCHEADAATGELGMWDTLKYSKYIGLGTSAPGTETWIGGRGFKTGTVTGGVVEADVALKNVKTDQNPSSPDDLYGATNMDFPEIDEKNYTVTVKGVVNPYVHAAPCCHDHVPRRSAAPTTPAGLR
ncbi:MAG: hypothetical protein ACLT98_13925 [Eggerthellaceae bacterium]